MKKISKFLNLSLSDKTLLARAWCALFMVRMGLTLLPFVMVRKLVTGEKRTGTLQNDKSSVDRLAWAVAVASRFVPGSTCLVQAMALQYLLRRAGHPALMHIGVNKDQIGKLRAHAWVESRGRVLIGGSNFKEYTRLLALE